MSERLVTSIEDIPLNGDDLLAIAKCMGQTNSKVVMYDDLVKYTTIQELFPGSTVVVYILLDLHSAGAVANVGHWICLIYHKESSKYWYYDPYGMPPAKDLALTHEKSTILDLLKPVKYEYSSAKHQMFVKDVNTCGRHVVVRSIFNHLDNSEYDRQVIRPICPMYVKSPDVLVSIMTAFNSKSDQVLKKFYEKK